MVLFSWFEVTAVEYEENTPADEHSTTVYRGVSKHPSGIPRL